MPTRIDDERQDALLDLSKQGERTKAVAASQGQSPTAFIAIGAMVVLALVAFLAWPRGGEATAASPTTLPVTAAPTAVPTSTPLLSTATPSGPSISGYVDIIESHIKAGRYRDAMTTAEAALAIPGLHQADRRVLTGYVVSAGMKDIATQPFIPLDQAQHQRMVDTYLSLRERAMGADVPIDTPLQIARSAFTSSQFPLARVALDQALKDGSFNPRTDRDITKLYVSTLYGLGAWYSTAPKDLPLFQEGLRWLVTSNLVAEHYETGQSEAEALLTKLGLPDSALWPQPMPVPLSLYQED